MIHLVGPINDRSYGIVTYNLLKELSQKTPTTFWPINLQHGLDYDYSLVKSCMEKQQYYQHGTSVRIWHQNDLALHASSRRVGFPIFELDKFTNHELSHLKSQSLVLVCSEWAKSILESYNIPAKVVPLGVNSRPNLAQTNQGRKFCTIGKWEVRKGHDILHKVFKAAFPTEDVKLYMCTYNPFADKFETDKWEREYKNELGDRVEFVDWYNSHSHLMDFLNKMDCGVFLSRAEGWNLGAMEMLSLGKPIVITNYSGHTEFCTKENSSLIEINALESAFDGKWFFGQGEWAKFGPQQFDQAVCFLREVYKNPKVNNEGIETAKKFSWANSAERLMNAIHY